MRYVWGIPRLFLGLAVSVAGCTPAPPVADSREVVWQHYGNRPVDALLVAWGVPSKESHMTDGSRLLTYRHATLYDAQTPYERASVCEVTVIAKQPRFLVSDIAMQGAPMECQMLAQGRTGDVRVPAVEPLTPYRNAYPYRRYPF